MALTELKIPAHVSSKDNFLFESFDHGKSMLAGLRHLRQMQQLFDVILVAEDEEFPVHRVVMASCSDYFRAMFTDGLKECTQSRINLNGLTANSIAHLIDFAYSSSINIDSENVMEVLAGATHVQILPVISACENYLRNHLSVDNCISTAEVAELFCLCDLQQHALNYICNHWSIISMFDEFLLLDSHFLVSLLSSGYAVDCKEGDVLISVLSWFAYSPVERVHSVKSILNCVIFEFINEDDFYATLNSKEWFDLKSALPHLLGFFPIFMSTDIDSLREVSENIISVQLTENTVESSRYLSSLSPLWRSKIPNALQSSECPPGLLNLRGFHYTILVVGGFRNESGMTNDIMYLDVDTGNLKYLSKIPHLDQINFGITVLRNQLYIIGGCFNDQMQEIAHPFGFRYNPASNTWISIAPMLQERCRFMLCATDDRIYAIGGDPNASNIGPENLASSEVYCPKTNKWTSIQPLPGNRSQLAGTPFRHYVAVSGGIRESEELIFRDFLLYDPSKDSWERRLDMLTPRADHSMFVWEGKIYIVGGWFLDSSTHKRVMSPTIDCYDFDSDSWSVVGMLKTPRTYSSYSLCEDCIFAIGGWTNGDRKRKSKTVDLFDLRAREWVEGFSTDYVLWEHSACSLYLPKYVQTKS